ASLASAAPSPRQSAGAAPGGDLFGSAAQPAPAGDGSVVKGDVSLTPIALAAVRAERGRAEKFDRSKYETVTTLARLNAWIARAHDAGIVAIDTETTSLDAMQAHLCGFSLAVAPNEACYVPIGHREG